MANHMEITGQLKRGQVEFAGFNVRRREKSGAKEKMMGIEIEVIAEEKTIGTIDKMIEEEKKESEKEDKVDEWAPDCQTCHHRQKILKRSKTNHNNIPHAVDVALFPFQANAVEKVIDNANAVQQSKSETDFVEKIVSVFVC